jgi:hypothetical protein
LINDTQSLTARLQIFSIGSKRELFFVCVSISLFFIISVIILRDSIFSPGLLTGGDNHVPITSVQWFAQLYRHFFIWDSFHLTGIPFAPLSDSYLHYLIRFPIFLVTHSIETTLKLFVPFALTIPGIGMYYMSYTLMNKKKIIAFACGILYMLNPWTFDRFVSGNTDMLIAYGLIPIVFTLVYQSVHNYEEKRRYDYKFLLAGMIGSIVAIQVQIFYILIGILLLYALFLFLVQFKKKRKYRNIQSLCRFTFKNRIVPVLLVMVILLVINAYWIIPLQFSPLLSRSVSSHHPAIEDLFFLSSKGSITNALRMSILGQTVDDIMHLNLGPFFNLWIASSVLLGLLLIASFAFTKLSSTRLFFAILLVIGLVFSMGTNAPAPLNSLYLFLYESFPLFYAFRDPSKWVVLISLSYSFILAGLLQRILTHRLPSSPVADKNHLGIKNRIIDKVIKKSNVASPVADKNHLGIKNRIIDKVIKKSNVALALIFFLVASIALPFFVDGSFGGNIQPINYPSEYPNFINWLSERNIQDRLALFPPDFETKYDWLLHSMRECNVPLCYLHRLDEQLYTYPIMSTIALRPSFIYPDAANSMTWWLYHTLYNNSTKYASQLFGLLNTKYFVIRNDAHPGSYNGAYMSFADTRIRNYIDKQIGLDLVYQKGNTSVYENNYALPHIYNANNLTLAVGDRNILNSLTYLHYPLLKYPVVFADELTSEQLIKLMPYVKHLVLDISKYEDLYFDFIPNKYLISPNDYATNTVNISSHWVSSDYAVHRLDYQGYFDSELGKFIYTEAKNSTINLPVELNSNTTYDVWIRIFKGKASLPLKPLKIGIDDKYMTEFDNHTNRFDQGFGWLKVGSAQLEPGKHNINLTSDGINAVSELALVPEHMLDAVKQNVHGLLEDYGVQIIYLLEGERLIIPPDNKSVKKIDFEASNGYALLPLNDSIFLRSNIVNAGYYDIVFRILNLTENDNLNIMAYGCLSIVPSIIVNQHRIPFDPNDSHCIIDNGKDKNSAFVSLNNIFLKEGKNTVELRMKNGQFLDLISIFPTGDSIISSDPSANKLANLGTDNIKEFDKINPSKYIVHNTENLPITVFLETYDRGWHINTNYSSAPVWSYGNAFITKENTENTNNKMTTLNYNPEIYYTIGKIVSILSILLVIACTIITLRRSFQLKTRKADQTMLKG